MIRLFIDVDFIPQKKVALSAPQEHYLCHVMRLKMGDKIICFNGKQGDWLTSLEKQKKEVCLILEKQILPQQKRKGCILCISLIKREPLNYVFQKATELGVTQIYLIQAERSVREKVNMERVKSIVLEACEQCERNDIPDLIAPQPLHQILDQLKGKVCPIWLSERGTTDGIKIKLPPAFFIGPEGGWTKKEEELFKDNAVYSWHLGDTILRAETAAMTAIALWQYQDEIKMLAI